jgi:hypothetical protein
VGKELLILLNNQRKKTYFMENITPNKGGFYMQTEDLNEELKQEAAPQAKEDKEKFKDWYEFFPDASL